MAATCFLAIPASAQVGVGQPAVTIIVDPQGTASTPPGPAETPVPTNGVQTIPTIPTGPTTPTTPAGPTAPIASNPTTASPTTRPGRRTTTTKRGKSTTRKGVTSSTTLATTTVLELAPIPDGGTSTAPPVVVGDTEPTTKPSTTVVTSDPATNSSRPTSSSKSSTSGPTTTLPASTPSELRRRIQDEVQKAGGSPGVIVIVDGQTMADIGSTQPRLPASTQKLYVAAAALNYLGTDFRFETAVKSDSIAGGSVTSLTLIGAGDPTLTTSDLRALANQIRNAGVSAVTQQLLVDDSHFDRLTTAPGWKPSFSPGEAGLLSALMIDGNHRNDAPFKADPALANLTKFQQELQRAGIAVTGAALGRGNAPANTTTIAKHSSDALGEIVATMAKKSNNTYAEMVLKEIGAANGAGSTAAGASAVNAYMAKLGVTAPMKFADGSGLSSLDRTTAASEAALLTKVDAGKHGSAFRSSLAIACVDGTLRSRLCGTKGAGTVIGKTGTIDNVAALTGYCVTASGRKVVFSFLLNDLRSSSTGRGAIDKALLQVIGYTG